ncbi:MAG: dienelactone hydrolase family protein [Acidobacteria bacterium]|nr:dienelactone hydrolase family protein [Acidobacteriota bacterium]
MRRARNIAGGAAAVTAALTSFGLPAKGESACAGADDLRVPADAEDLEVIDIEFAGPESTLFAHLAKPKRESTDPLPAVIVIHENRGLTDHIKDVTRRVARAGYVSLGIDLVSRLGGTPSDPAQQAGRYNMTTPAGRLADLQATVAYLATQPDVRGDRIGTVGFCAGGGNVWALAVSGADTAANVVYYGSPVPPADQIPNIKGAVFCHYAELDRNLTNNAAPTIPAMVNARKTFGFSVHEGAGHAFNNDTGNAFNATVACEAWARTLRFFATHLMKE